MVEKKKLILRLVLGYMRGCMRAAFDPTNICRIRRYRPYRLTWMRVQRCGAKGRRVGVTNRAGGAKTRAGRMAKGEFRPE